MPKLSTPAAEKIREKLAAIRPSISEKERAETARSEEDARLSREEDELDRLEKTVRPDDAMAITRLMELRVKVPARKRGLPAFERAVEEADRKLTEARGDFYQAVAEAAREISEGRRTALIRAVEAVEDRAFGLWCGDPGPRVVEAERFAANPEQVGLPVEQLAQVVGRGEIPQVKPPELPTAGLVATSQMPAPLAGGQVI
jgi:hypothetical protein